MNILLGIAIFVFGLGLFYISMAQGALRVNLAATETENTEEALKFMRRFNGTSLVCFIVSGIFFALAF